VLLRYAAPAAFLLVVTVVALAARSGLRSEGQPAKAQPAVKRAEASSTATRAKRAPPKRWYVIQSGDTLGAIAARYGTTVDGLLRLNPGVVPTTLAPGTQLRIR
jgi:LysM repeat protein